MRKFFISIISLLLIVTIIYISWGLRARNVKKIYLKTTEVYEKDYPTALGLLKIKELVNKYSEGKIIIDLYTSAQLGSEIDTIMQTQLGLVDITRVNINSLMQIAKEFEVFAVPYLFRDKEHLWKVLNGEIGRNFLKSLEQYGLIGLGFYDAGQQSFYNSIKPIKSINDIHDLRISVSENIFIKNYIEALGAVSVSIKPENIYSLIKTGVINGAINNELYYYYSGNYKIAKFYSYTEHSRTPDIILMSKKSWDNMIRKDQDYIIDAVKESIPYQLKLMKKKGDEAVDICKKSGCEFFEVDKDPFKKVTDELYKTYPQEIIDLARKIKAVK